MVGRLRRRLLTVALTIALLATAAYAASSLGTFTTAVPSVRLARSMNSPEQAYGTLSMDVLLGIRETFYGPQSLPTYFKPILGERVSISLSDSPAAIPLIVQTNASGLIRVDLPISDYYAATINDMRFHVTIPFSILANTTTNVVVRAVRVSSPVLFDESNDSMPTGNGTAQSIFIKVRSAAEFSNSSLSLFLEKSGSIIKNFVDPQTNASITQIPVKIVGGFGGRGGAWLQLESAGEVGRADRAQLFLVTYVPVYIESVGSR